MLRIHIKSHTGTPALSGTPKPRLLLRLINAGLMDNNTQRQNASKTFVFVENVFDQIFRLEFIQVGLAVTTLIVGSVEPFDAKGSISFEKACATLA